MKLTVAASFLAASLSSSASSASLVQKAITKDHAFRASRPGAGRSLQHTKGAGPKALGPKGLNDFIQGRIQKERGSKVRNLIASETGPVKGCDPHADVGVLSCGPGRYCLETKLAHTNDPKAAESAMGGICVQDINVGRRVQSKTSYPIYYNSTSDPFPYNFTDYNAIEWMEYFCNSPYSSGCDCDVDVPAYRGSMTCVYLNSCFMAYSNCGTANETFCTDSIWSTNITAEGEGFSTNCLFYTEPFVWSECRNYTVKDNIPDTCSLKVNDELCNSCVMEETTIGYGNYTYPYFCGIFDCTNTDLDTAGSLCNESLTSTALDEAMEALNAVDDLPCPGGCSLCDDGGSFALGQYFDFNASYGPVYASCYFLGMDALRGISFYGPEDNPCESPLREILLETCQCVTAAPTEAPGPSRALRSSSSIHQAEPVASDGRSSGADHPNRMRRAAGASAFGTVVR